MENNPISRRHVLSRFGVAAFAGAALNSRAQTPHPPSGATANAINVVEFGAVGDGVKDNTEAFNNALKAAGAGSIPIVFVPRGQYLINGHLDLPSNVTLEGIFKGPAARTHNEGSVLLAVAGEGEVDGQPFIKMHTSSTLRGITIYYPHQKMQNPPTPYPWTIRGEGDNICLLDVMLINPYQAVDFGTLPCGRHYIDGLYGQPLFRGVFVDKCYDVGRIENVHFWSFWGGWDGPLYDFMRAQGVAFVMARTDWEFMSRIFCIGYSIGFHFIAKESGPGNCVITESGSDLGPNPVRVDASQSHAGHTFVNCQFMAGIHVAEGNSGPVKFTACGFWGMPATDHHALLEGSGHVFFNSCHFIGWGQKDAQAPAIHAKRGGLTVTASDFIDVGKAQVTVESAVDAALIFGNRFRGKEQVINRAPKEHVEIGMNVVSAI